MYAAERSTLVGSFPENAPPPCGAYPPYVSTIILRPVRPQSPSGPPTTKLPVGLTRKSEDFFGIQPSGSADATVSAINSFTMPGVYFLPLRLEALCCVETTTLVQPTALPSTYCTVTWLLASGCRSNSCLERRLSARTFRIRCAKKI